MSIHSTMMRSILIMGLVIVLISPTYAFSKSIKSDDLKKKIENNASELTSDLQSKINLTESQVSAIKLTLINYLTNVSLIQFTQRAGVREKTYDVKSDPPSDLQDLNLNYEDNSLQDLKNEDIEANSKLDNIIPDTQKSKWKEVRDSWWNRVIAVQYMDND